MSDKAGFFAGCADTLTEMCFYYLVGGIFIMGRRGWGLHLGWLLLCALVCCLVFSLVLKKPRATTVLTVLTLALGAGCLGVFIAASRTSVGFGYGFVLAVGAGMAVGLPLYFCLHRPQVQAHLTHLDVLIVEACVLLLCRNVLSIDGGTLALVTVVLFLDAAGAVGLRVTDEDGAGGENVPRAALTALGAAVAVFIVVGLLCVLFARSGSLTGSVLHGIGAFFASIGGGIERFFQWLAALMNNPDSYEAVPIEGELPSVAQAETQAGGVELNVNTTVVGIVLVLVLLGIAAAVAILLRKKKFALKGAVVTSAPMGNVTRRSGRPLQTLWRRFMAALRFRWTAFRRRNTPGGLLIRLERLAARKKTPRQTGETMRRFIGRMDPTGGLTPLADALDREFYGEQGRAATPRQCREWGTYIKRSVKHG